ncbi:DUF6644 family protein [Dyadobacter psychrophilus]|uniref:DUF6644 domain-containing protein n=1 Tax=Dyadobacter psychrophilus TaxID=651661 RepID=A0A1T5DIG7_9BACT|nr:DUF6644 family protein [Dyadobacter psychrophilus]SKB71466.1 hypothetical protein SAMN05660293_01640 [Dyadobacter psychrophilus]
MLEFLDWLEKTSWAVGIRQSLWLYPALEIVHILGIVMLVGPAFMFDLRLLGFSQNIPFASLAEHLLPWSRRSLLLIIPSGALLFITNANALGVDPTFWTKMSLIGVAAINVFVFHRFIFKSNLNPNGNLPSQARISACISIIVWVAVIACGRLLAY